MHMTDNCCSVLLADTPLQSLGAAVGSAVDIHPPNNGIKFFNAHVDDGAGSIVASKMLMLL